jgi:hypothetical protein
MSENRGWVARLLRTNPAVLVAAVTALVEAAVLLGLLQPDAAHTWAAIVAGPLATIAAGFGIRQLVYSPASADQLRAGSGQVP